MIEGKIEVLGESFTGGQAVTVLAPEGDEAFIAEVPELPGCAADGETYQKALSNVQVIVAEWIETAEELGRPIPEPRGRLMLA